jgi:hypothetical protein
MLGGSHSGFGRSFLNPICGFHCIKVVEMKRTLIAVLTAALAMAGVEAGSQSEVARAREILETSAKAYKNVEALRDTLSYVINAPGSEQETKAQAYGFGPGRSVFVKNALLEAVALDKTFYLSQSDVPDKYVSASYDVISAAFSEAWLAPVPFSNRHQPCMKRKALMLAWTHFVSIFSNRCATPSEGTFCEDKLHASQDDAPLSC